MITFGCGYSVEPHGETFWEEWWECSHCGYRWSVNHPEDECECEELEERAQKESNNADLP